IYIHPAEFERSMYDELVPGGDKERLKRQENYQETHKDPLFATEGDIYRPDPGSLFYKTLAGSGRDAYVLKEHVFLLYKDLREMEQAVIKEDPTDYRIEEPLPEGFPIARPTGFRGYGAFALGAPQYPSYNYNSRVNDVGYDFLKEFNFVWSKNVDFDLTRRFFFGGMINIAASKVEYRLKDRDATESNFKFSIGPLVSNDLWRNDDYRFNAYTSLQLAPLDQLDIEQSSDGPNAFRESRSFSSLHFSPRAGASLQKPDLFYQLDLLLGANINWDLARDYSTSDGSQREKWWSGDSFTRASSFQITYFLGLQSDY
ncbi:MAG: hypothetical protein WEB87_05845, partial [Bacteriovoracaceae bacterium]